MGRDRACDPLCVIELDDGKKAGYRVEGSGSRVEGGESEIGLDSDAECR